MRLVSCTYACPKCGRLDDKVIDSRRPVKVRSSAAAASASVALTVIRPTEEIEHEGLMIVKRDGRREEFSKEKIVVRGPQKACQKRPVSPKIIEDLVEKIVDEITDKYDREVPSMAIGERVIGRPPRH